MLILVQEHVVATRRGMGAMNGPASRSGASSEHRDMAIIEIDRRKMISRQFE